MVSVITDKLKRQVLDDEEDTGASLEAEPETGCASRKVAEIHSSRDSLASSTNFPEPKSVHISNGCCCSSFIRSEEAVGGGGEGGGGLHNDFSTIYNTGDGKCRLCCSSTGVLRMPAKRRQCHLMSSPDETDERQWQSCWQPQVTSIWRPVGFSVNQSQNNVLGFPALANLTIPMPSNKVSCNEWRYSDEPVRRLSISSDSPSPIQRPASASSGFLENSGGSLTVAGCSVSSIHSPSLSAFSLTGLSLNESQKSFQIVPSSTGSMPAISYEEITSCSYLSQPQRCHSQPSVLSEQRCIKKRRHEEKRPNLNFIKMKETAYARRHQVYNRTRSLFQFTESTNLLQMSKAESDAQSKFFHSLDTIASSPQELPFSQEQFSPFSEMKTQRTQRDSDFDDHYQYRESLDSGCSGDLVSCLESLDGQTDFNPKLKQLNEGIEEEEVFDLDILDELDIEKIEKN